MIASNITYANTYLEHPIKTDPTKGYGCHMEILHRIKLLLDYGLSKGAIFAYRFDLRYPDFYICPTGNSLLSSLMAYFIQRLKTKDKYLYPLYLWVRERTSAEFNHNERPSEHCHYHVLMIVQKWRCQNEYGHLLLADQLWQMKLGLIPKKDSGLLHRCDSQVNGVVISEKDPNFHSVYKNSYNRFSYLSKINSKGNAPIYVKEFDSSQLPSDFYPLL